MIAVSHLSKHFGDIHAVDDISFTVNEGEHFVLLGTSGCGKTTTLKMINRLFKADAGAIKIKGEANDRLSPELLRRRMGYVLQNTGLFPHYTVEENIAVVPGLLGWDKRKTRDRTNELLKKFNLEPETYLPLYPEQLSGGQQQRVGFTRALVADPPILLMDEPLGALDPVTRHQMRREFKQLNELKGKTIVTVTHDIPEAIELGDRICVMDEGKIQQIDTAENLLMHPANDFVRHFFAHDHFMLQLRACLLRDFLFYFPETDDLEEAGLLDPGISLLEAIEELASFKADKKEMVVKSKGENKFYKIDLPLLFTAIQQKSSAR